MNQCVKANWLSVSVLLKVCGVQTMEQSSNKCNKTLFDKVKVEVASLFAQQNLLAW